MARLLVTADIHGSLDAWMALKSLLEPGDALAVAGDLFDTRYGNPRNPDFQPGAIRDDLATLECPVYYVYGNCDEAEYFPSRSYCLDFQFIGRRILIHHGHLPLETPPESTRIIIQGHTHCCSLECRNSRILLNPGSLARPRDSVRTYAVIDSTRVSLINLRTGHPESCLDLNPSPIPSRRL